MVPNARSPAAWSPARPRWNVSSPVKSSPSSTLVYMGSFMPYKNVETLPLAMRSLPDYRLHLLSKMPPRRLVQLTRRTPHR